MTLDAWSALRHSDAKVAVGRGGDRTGRQLCAGAEALHVRLAGLLGGGGADVGGGQVLLLCDDRYHFAVGLLGAWQAGLGVALPSGRGSAALSQLAMAETTVARVTDHDMASVDAVPDAIDLRLLDASGVQDAADPQNTPSWTPAPMRIAATLYTSGTTGGPRGIDKRFDQLLGEARMLGEQFGFAGATVLSTVPGHHIYGLLWGVLAPLLAGGCFVRETPLLAGEIAHLARAHACTLLVAVPAHLQAIEAAQAAPDFGPALGGVISSGAPLDGALAARLERRLKVPVVEILGSTETGGIASRRPVSEEAWKPLSGVRVESGDGGQLCVRSAYTDVGDGQLQRCADRIELLPGGTFTHLGRSDRVVKVGARRLDLAEMEARLCSLPAVREAHVIATPVAGIREHEIACVLVAAPTLDRAAIRAQLSPWFDQTLLPRRVCSVPAIDRGDSGKVSRQTLLALLDASAAVTGDADVDDHAADHEDDGDGLFEWRQRPAQCGADNSWRGSLRVRPSAWCFEGHFDGDPLLAGVVQLNNLALPQARALWPDLASLRRARALKFKLPVRPGDVLALELRRTDGDGDATVRFALQGEGGACASGSLIFETSTRGPA